MTDNSLVPVERIENAILVIRGHRVIMDKDLHAVGGRDEALDLPIFFGGPR